MTLPLNQRFRAFPPLSMQQEKDSDTDDKARSAKETPEAISPALLRDFLDIDFHGNFTPWAKKQMRALWDDQPSSSAWRLNYTGVWLQTQKIFHAAAEDRIQEMEHNLVEQGITNRYALIDSLPFIQSQISDWDIGDWIWEVFYLGCSFCWEDMTQDLLARLDLSQEQRSQVALRQAWVFARFGYVTEALALLSSGIFKKSTPAIQHGADQFFSFLTQQRLRGE